MPRTTGHYNREARLSEIRKRRLQRRADAAMQKQDEKEDAKKLHAPHTTRGTMEDIRAVTEHIYTDDEIKRFKMKLALDNHPLARKPVNMRSKLAYAEIMQNVPVSPKYLLPGMIAVFGYKTPKTKDQLEYYDATPATIFFGITRTTKGAIREIGFNLHYFPPFARMKIITLVYTVFKHYYDQYFNEVPTRPSKVIDYHRLKKMLDKYGIGFGLRMYIPILRGKTYILPTRMVPTMAFTEGHFNGATLAQIQKYWRKRRR